MGPLEPESQFAKLIEGLESGQRSAFDALVAWFWDPIYRFFWKRVPICDADDLTQEVFISLYRAVRNGAGPAESSMTHWRRYLFGSAQNTLTSHWRKKGRGVQASSLEELFRDDEASWQDAVPSASDKSPDSDPLVSEEQRVAVRDCMGNLDETSRAVFWSHFADGRSKREIATCLKVAESSLRDRMVRAMGDLKLCLQEKGIEWVS